MPIIWSPLRVERGVVAEHGSASSVRVPPASGSTPGHCQLTAFGTWVREGQIEILAPAARSGKIKNLYAERRWCMSSAWV